MIVVHLVQDNNNITSAKSLTVTTLPSDQTHRVTVIGPSTVMADQPNSYRAKVTSCLDTMQKNYIRYKVGVSGTSKNGIRVYEHCYVTGLKNKDLITLDIKPSKFQFTWRVLGSRALNIFQGRRITIPPNVLVANKNQTLVVSVISPGHQISGTVSIL